MKTMKTIVVTPSVAAAALVVDLLSRIKRASDRSGLVAPVTFVIWEPEAYWPVQQIGLQLLGAAIAAFARRFKLPVSVVTAHCDPARSAVTRVTGWGYLPTPRDPVLEVVMALVPSATVFQATPTKHDGHYAVPEGFDAVDSHLPMDESALADYITGMASTALTTNGAVGSIAADVPGLVHLFAEQLPHPDDCPLIWAKAVSAQNWLMGLLPLPGAHTTYGVHLEGSAIPVGQTRRLSWTVRRQWLSLLLALDLLEVQRGRTAKLFGPKSGDPRHRFTRRSCFRLVPPAALAVVDLAWSLCSEGPVNEALFVRPFDGDWQRMPVVLSIPANIPSVGLRLPLRRQAADGYGLRQFAADPVAALAPTDQLLAVDDVSVRRLLARLRTPTGNSERRQRSHGQAAALWFDSAIRPHPAATLALHHAVAITDAIRRLRDQLSDHLLTMVTVNEAISHAVNDQLERESRAAVDAARTARSHQATLPEAGDEASPNAL